METVLPSAVVKQFKLRRRETVSDGVKGCTHKHWAHSGRVWSTGEPQVMLGDVLTRPHDGDVLPADALLRSVG